MSTFLLLVFPTGHLPPPHWRPVARAAGITITGISLVARVPGADEGLPPNPLGIQQMAWLRACRVDRLPAAGHHSGVTGAQRSDPRPSRGGRAGRAPAGHRRRRAALPPL